MDPGPDGALVTAQPRWRSNRRRSNEKSAAAIRRETPPFWQCHTDGGPVDEHGLYVIQRVKDGYEVIVNGKPTPLPRTIRIGHDDVTLRDTGVRTIDVTAARWTRSDLWRHQPWTRKGARADYRAVASGPVTHRNRLVLSEPFLLAGGKQWCTLIEGVRGWVAVEALSKPDEPARGPGL
jgi:hypothetical protein